MAERLGIRAITHVAGFIPSRAKKDPVCLGKALPTPCLRKNVPVLTVSRSSCGC